MKETDQLLTNVRNLEQEKQEVEDRINLTKEAVRGTSVQVQVLKSHTNSIQRSIDILDQSIKEKKAYLTMMRAKLEEMSEKHSSMVNNKVNLYLLIETKQLKFLPQTQIFNPYIFVAKYKNIGIRKLHFVAKTQFF